MCRSNGAQFSMESSGLVRQKPHILETHKSTIGFFAPWCRGNPGVSEPCFIGELGESQLLGENKNTQNLP